MAFFDSNSLCHIIGWACNDVFVPITVRGRISNVRHVQTALDSGAEEVAINMQAIYDPYFIERAAKILGSPRVASLRCCAG